jgi:hypothetical protein
LDLPANSGRYAGLTGTTVLGSLVAPSGPGPGEVSIQDGDPESGIGWDGVGMNVTTDPANRPVVDGVILLRFVLSLPSSSYDLFSDAALNNIVGLELADLNGYPRDFEVQLFNPTYFSQYMGRGRIDALSISTVPLPAAAWLLGSALGVLGWMRRRVC